MNCTDEARRRLVHSRQEVSVKPVQRARSRPFRLLGSARGELTHFALTFLPNRQDKGDAAAKELIEATGRKCTFASVDVRKPDTLKAAVQKCIEIYGKIDFVICGE